MENIVVRSEQPSFSERIRDLSVHDRMGERLLQHIGECVLVAPHAKNARDYFYSRGVMDGTGALVFSSLEEAAQWKYYEEHPNPETEGRCPPGCSEESLFHVHPRISYSRISRYRPTKIDAALVESYLALPRR